MFALYIGISLGAAVQSLGTTALISKSLLNKIRTAMAHSANIIILNSCLEVIHSK